MVYAQLYIAQRSELNGKCNTKANLLMIVAGENRNYTAIKNLSRLPKCLNVANKGAYRFYINYLKDFHTASARDKHCNYYSSNGYAKVKMLSEKEKWLKFNDGQYYFKVSFMLYADSRHCIHKRSTRIYRF